MKKCRHEEKTNFAVTYKSIQHEYCPTCGWHLYRGKEYTKKEWYDKYIKEEIESLLGDIEE